MSKSMGNKKDRQKVRKDSATNKKKDLKSSKSPDATATSSKKFLKIAIAVLCLIILATVSIFVLPQFFVKKSGELSIVYPFDGSLFPPEIIAPTFWWSDENPGTESWQITIEFEDNARPINIEVDRTEWTPEREMWESIKKRSLEKTATLTISGLKRIAGIKNSLSSQRITISTSKDSVGAPIFYRDVPLPFRFALRNVDKIKWRLGDISSSDPPPTVLTNLPVCGNCHSFSADGKTLGMDVDIGNDKGAYVLTAFEEQTILSREKLISWTDFVRDVKVPTFGMLPRVSPDGRYVLSGVKDRSVFLPRLDILFSQIFFPVMGILAYYDKEAGEIYALPGADDEQFVQANGAWTADGEYVVFARNQAARLQAKPDKFKDIILNKAESIEVLGGEEFLEKPQQSEKKFMYSLYRVPFNNGKGGKAEPIPGASHNGMSNYFPKFSPDGKWLVFTQAHSFMLLQPDSKLYIMPAEGGEPRLMNCNTNRMNSWHSWSPNSKWLVFSSKVFSPNTQLFLTHIAEDGSNTPPILLRNFTPLDEDRGANIPEFANIKPGAARMIYERFLDDYNYFRSGRIYEQFREYDRAEQEFLKALKINPQNTFSHYSLATIYAEKKDYERATKEFEAVLELDPDNAIVHKDLGSLYFTIKQYDKAENEFKTTLKIDSKNIAAHYDLGSLYILKGEFDKAESEFRAVLNLEPDSENVIGVHFNLGSMYINTKDVNKAREEFETVVKLDPKNVDAHHNLGQIYIKLNKLEQAKEQFNTMAKLDPANVAAHIELGQLYVDNKDYEYAITEFKTVLELAPNNLFARVYLGRIYIEKEDYDKAKEIFLEILGRDPNNIYAHINLGKMYTETEQFDSAIKEFKTVLELDPGDANACFMLGELLSEKKGATDEAISYLKKGLSINPKYFDGHILLGNLYLKTGDVTNAIHEFELALKLDPTAPALKEKIKELKTR